MKRTLNKQKAKLAGDDKAELALVAWELVGLLVAIFAVVSIIGMIPEMMRYLKLKNM